MIVIVYIYLSPLVFILVSIDRLYSIYNVHKKIVIGYCNYLYLSPFVFILAAPAPAWALTTLCWWFWKCIFCHLLGHIFFFRQWNLLMHAGLVICIWCKEDICTCRRVSLIFFNFSSRSSSVSGSPSSACSALRPSSSDKSIKFTLIFRLRRSSECHHSQHWELKWF